MSAQPASDPPASDEVAFLHRLDGVTGEQAIALTDRAALRGASFLDGRERFWRALEVSPFTPSGRGRRPACRFVFHVGFCGSTLLARLLDRPGRVLALKEPQCLADIAGQRQQLARGEGVASIGELLDHALGRLGEVAEGGGSVLVKPSNWVNPLLGELCAGGRVERGVFLSMAPRAYLGAVFRGGRARIEFCTRLAAEVAAVMPRGNALLIEAIGHDDDPLGRAARIAALLHRLQETLFARVIADNGWPGEARIEFADLVADPAAAADRARRALGLDPSEDAGISRELLERHAKNPASAFSSDKRAGEDAMVESVHGERFDQAMEWLDRAWAQML
jgi:hypothetical protein